MKRIACPVLSLVLAVVLAMAPTCLQAQGSEHAASDPVPVETPREPVVISDYQPSSDGPQIVIRPGDHEVFYEYRVNGQLMEIKVVPEVGVPYYLVPADTGGWIRETESDLLVPSWVLFRW